MGITEEDEEEEIEEVDDFSPGLRPGEFVVDVCDDAVVPDAVVLGSPMKG